MMRSNTQTVTLDQPAAVVFDFVARPENLPLWAISFCQAIERDGNAWLVSTPGGQMRLRYEVDSRLGVIDFHRFSRPDVELVASSRVIPNGAGSEYVFTQFQAPGMSDEAFADQVRALEQELATLKRRLEN